MGTLASRHALSIELAKIALALPKHPCTVVGLDFEDWVPDRSNYIVIADISERAQA